MSIHKRYGIRSNTYRVMWRDPDGRQRSKSFDTLADAKRFDAEVHLGRAPSRPDTTTRSTIKQWLEEWFAMYHDEWRITTTRQRGHICDKWIVPLIGNQRLGSFDNRAAREFRQQMLSLGASNKTVNSVMSVLSASLTAAVEQDLIEFNPTKSLRNLGVTSTAAAALTPLEVETYRYWMKNDRDRLIVSLIAYAGLRPAEVCGLQWKHIRENHILVEQSAQAGQIVNTKTGRARVVEICDALRTEIDKYRPVDAEPDDLVVPGERGGILNWKNWFRRVWCDAGDHCALSFRPYDLRHTFASMQIHSGKNVIQVAAELGHANPTMTLNVYGHLFTESQLKSRTSVDDAIRAARIELASCPPRSEKQPA